MNFTQRLLRLARITDVEKKKTMLARIDPSLHDLLFDLLRREETLEQLGFHVEVSPGGAIFVCWQGLRIFLLISDGDRMDKSYIVAPDVGVNQHIPRLEPEASAVIDFLKKNRATFEQIAEHEEIAEHSERGR